LLSCGENQALRASIYCEVEFDFLCDISLQQTATPRMKRMIDGGGLCMMLRIAGYELDPGVLKSRYGNRMLSMYAWFVDTDIMEPILQNWLYPSAEEVGREDAVVV
jgi:hypothetical protein